MPKIALLTSPGLAPVTAAELTLLGLTLTDARTVFLRNNDLLVGDIESSVMRGLFKLRTVEDIFLVLNDGPPPKDKKVLGKIIPPRFKDLILSGVPYLPKRKNKGAATGFAVFVKQDHDHEIYRKQIAAVISNSVEANFSKWKTKDPAEVEFWAFLTDKYLTFGMRLTRSSFRERNYRDEERAASLRPTIAAALVVLSNPVEGERFLDPMCGTGTILLERSRFAPAGELHGYDTDEKALESAKASAEKADVQIQLEERDSTLPRGAPSQTFDKIVCNLPFGKTFSTEDDLPGLYESAMNIWKKALSPQGEMILLTSETKMLEEVAYKAGLKCKFLAKVRVKGLKAGIVQAVIRNSKNN